MTGEYPPQPGGVSDYTRQVATALAADGEDVHVWAPGTGPDTLSGGVHVHRLSPGFSARGLLELSARARRLVGPKRWFIQYVPHAFGTKAANWGFVGWVLARRHDRVWVMFHEVSLPWGGLRMSALSALHRAMAQALCLRADTSFVSTSAWLPRLPRVRRADAIWLPIPSNLPVSAPDRDRARMRLGFVTTDTTLIGHFGTYSPWLRTRLVELGPALLRDAPNRALLLLGRGSDVFAESLRSLHPALASRIHAAGSLPDADVVERLTASDVLLQPLPDGVNTRRTSLMAGLALGRPIVSNLGHGSEPLWTDCNALSLAEDANFDSILAAARELLSNPKMWAPLGQRAAAFYRSRFSLQQTLSVLRERARSEALADPRQLR